MKIQIIATILSLFMGFTTFSALRDPNNPPVGSTGAPNENASCNYSGCHNNGAMTGSVTVTGLPDSIVAGQTYTINLTVRNNATGGRGGFQMTCLDAANAPAGTFVATNTAAVSIGSGNTTATTGRKYPRQAKPINFASNVATWTYNWTAPTTLPTMPITFYYVGMIANSDGVEGGDNSITGKKLVYKKLTTPTTELETTLNAHVYPNPTSDFLFVELADKTEANLMLFDLQGRAVLNTVVSSNKQPISIKHLAKGAYSVAVESEGKMMSKKIVIQ
jgi:hypothetical protein